MRWMLYRTGLVLWLPVDLLRFTVDAWRYTVEWISYCVFGNSPEQPCIYCRGLDVGSRVPRRVAFRIHYRNLWLVKLLQPELAIRNVEGRMRPRVACMREGGYIRLPWYVPVLAGCMGLFWIALALAVFRVW